MYEVFVEPFSLEFMRFALIQVGLLAVMGAVCGVHVLLHRAAFLAEALQHAVFPGIALAYVLGQSVLLGAAVAALALIGLSVLVGRSLQRDNDATMAVLMTAFFALGVVLVSRQSSYQHDLTSFLFGRLLSVDETQLIETGVLAVITLAVLGALHKELVLRAFDPTAAQALGYRIARLDLVFHIVVAIVVIASVRAVGTVLLLAFLVTPAVTTRFLTQRIWSMMAIAAVGTFLCGWLGLALSYELSIDHGVDVASGAAVVVCITVVFAVIAMATAVRKRLAS